jgi:hypothetical protein
MLKTLQSATEKVDYHSTEKCGGCHNGVTVMSHKRVFDLRDRVNCMKCHTAP